MIFRPLHHGADRETRADVRLRPTPVHMTSASSIMLMIFL